MKKIEDIYNGLDTIPACDRQTDRQTDGQTDGHLATAYTRCAKHTRRAVKIKYFSPEGATQANVVRCSRILAILLTHFTLRRFINNF